MIQLRKYIFKAGGLSLVGILTYVAFTSGGIFSFALFIFYAVMVLMFTMED